MSVVCGVRAVDVFDDKIGEVAQNGTRLLDGESVVLADTADGPLGRVFARLGKQLADLCGVEETRLSLNVVRIKHCKAKRMSATASSLAPYTAFFFRPAWGGSTGRVPSGRQCDSRRNTQ